MSQFTAEQCQKAGADIDSEFASKLYSVGFDWKMISSLKPQHLKKLQIPKKHFASYKEKLLKKLQEMPSRSMTKAKPQQKTAVQLPAIQKESIQDLTAAELRSILSKIDSILGEKLYSHSVTGDKFIAMTEKQARKCGVSLNIQQLTDLKRKAKEVLLSQKKGKTAPSWDSFWKNLQALPAFSLAGKSRQDQKRKLEKARGMFLQKFPGSVAPSVDSLLPPLQSEYVPNLKSVEINSGLYQITNDLNHFKKAWAEAEIPMKEDSAFTQYFNVVGRVTEIETDDDTVLLEFEQIKSVEAEDDMVLLEHAGSTSLWLPVTCLRVAGEPRAKSPPKKEKKQKKAPQKKQKKQAKPKQAPAKAKNDEEAEKAKIWKEIQDIDADVFKRLKVLEKDCAEIASRPKQPAFSRKDVEKLMKKQNAVLSSADALQERLDNLSGKPSSNLLKLAERAEKLAKKIDSNAKLSKEVDTGLKTLEEEDKLAMKLEKILADQEERMNKLAEKLQVELPSSDDVALAKVVKDKQLSVLRDARTLEKRIKQLEGGSSEFTSAEAKKLKERQIGQIQAIEALMGRLDALQNPNLAKQVEEAQVKVLNNILSLESRIAKLEGSPDISKEVEAKQVKLLQAISALSNRIAKLEGKDPTAEASGIIDRVLSGAKSLEARIRKLEGGSEFPSFLPMDNACGKIKGYKHRKGKEGVGYYLENKDQASAEALWQALGRKYDTLISKANKILSGSSVSTSQSSSVINSRDSGQKKKAEEALSKRFDRIEDRLRIIEPKVRLLFK